MPVKMTATTMEAIAIELMQQYCAPRQGISPSDPAFTWAGFPPQTGTHLGDPFKDDGEVILYWHGHEVASAIFNVMPNGFLEFGMNHYVELQRVEYYNTFVKVCAPDRKAAETLVRLALDAEEPDPDDARILADIQANEYIDDNVDWDIMSSRTTNDLDDVHDEDEITTESITVRLKDIIAKLRAIPDDKKTPQTWATIKQAEADLKDAELGDDIMAMADEVVNMSTHELERRIQSQAERLRKDAGR